MEVFRVIYKDTAISTNFKASFFFYDAVQAEEVEELSRGENM